MQLLHVAAHIDAIDHEILPRLRKGNVVILDRFWWSTVVYGNEAGVEPTLLNSMIEVEKQSWGHITPACIFLITRSKSFEVKQEHHRFQQLSDRYAEVGAREASNCPVMIVANEGPKSDAADAILGRITRIVRELVP